MRTPEPSVLGGATASLPLCPGTRGQGSLSHMGGQQPNLPHRPVGTKGAACLEISLAKIWRVVPSQCIAFISII